MSRFLFVAGTVLSATAVALGAYAAHGLEAHVDAQKVRIFETGVQYHLFHALALVITGVLLDRRSSRTAQWAGGLFLFGILFFSVSLYLFVLTDSRYLLRVTPVGGIAFMVGWMTLAFYPLRAKPS